MLQPAFCCFSVDSTNHAFCELLFLQECAVKPLISCTLNPRIRRTPAHVILSRVAQDLSHRVRNRCVPQNSHSALSHFPFALQSDLPLGHLPHATLSHAQSLHSTDDMCAWLKGLNKLKTNCVPITFTHPRVMFRLAPYSTLNTSTSSLLVASPVLHSSSSPTPDLLSTHPFTHCKDPRQDFLRNTNLSQVMSPKGSSSTGPCSTFQIR